MGEPRRRDSTDSRKRDTSPRMVVEIMGEAECVGDISSGSEFRIRFRWPRMWESPILCDYSGQKYEAGGAGLRAR